MKRLYAFTFAAALCALLAACAGSTALPTETPFLPPPESSEVYAGEGAAYAWHDGKWVDRQSYSYEFMAIKRLYSEHWNTVKQLYRLHPDYSGLAGPREQTLFFRVQFRPVDNGYALQIEGTLGKGTGRTNEDMSESLVELTPQGIGFLRPFNLIRITQHLDRASGTMNETVELLKVRASDVLPFMKFEEHGTVYLPP
jgi:hypothetical protein